MYIYQVYHKKESEQSLLNRSYIIPYYVKDDKGINHLNEVLNEFVCQYYVYKYEKYNDDDIIGFYHYRRFYTPNDDEINTIENNVKNLNDIYALQWYNIKDVLGYNNKRNFLYYSLKKYISRNYPKMLSKFKNLDWYYKSVRFECFISRYDEFCKYVEFVLGYFKFMNIDFEDCDETYIKNKIDKRNKFIIEYYNNNKYPWYLHPNNHYRKISYIIELLCGLYWSLFGKNVKFLLSDGIEFT
jgi:hypothetical protein